MGRGVIRSGRVDRSVLDGRQTGPTAQRGLTFRPVALRYRSAGVNRSRTQDRIMHYPHRISRLKRKRSIGFRARMETKNGRKLMNRKRRAGRSLNVADK